MSSLSKKVNPVTGLTMGDCAFLEAYQRLKSGQGAYRELHPDANEQTCNAGGKALLAKPAIIAYLAKVQSQAQIAASCTLADHLRSLAVLRNACVAARQYRAAIYAEELRGKASGHYQVNVRMLHALTPEVLAGIKWETLSEQDRAAIEAGKASDELIQRVIASARTAPVSVSS